MTSKITLGGGCFWCVEAVYQRLKGVINITSGYSGGNSPDPTYRQVCNGSTGHAEVIQIEYDENIISYEQLLKVFFSSHDPTTLNRQGADIGSQYRSVIFYENDQQKENAIQLIESIKDLFGSPIITEVKPLKNFYQAEGHHQNYYNDNENKPYCQAVISPKLQKLRASFESLMVKD